MHSSSVAAKPLLNAPEQVLYGRLVRAFPGHIILSHVALPRLSPPAEAAHPSAPPRRGAERRRYVADFVVCRPDFTAVAVVELEEAIPGERSRSREAQQARRRLKDRVLQAAGIKVIRVSSRDIPGESALKALVAALPVHASTDELVRRAS